MKKTSIFIVPRASTAWRGNEAGWITASGWAAAGKQLWGEALVATTDGVFSPQESMLFPRDTNSKKKSSQMLKFLRNLIPEFLITGYKDWNLRRSKPDVWPIEDDGLLQERQVVMVWERHDLFPGPGRRLAQKLGVPFIISVEAAVVWEAKKWGVRRPFWGNWLERNVEAKSLKSADLVSCVSDEVREKVIQLGVPPERVVVSPNRVDSTVFNPGIDGTQIVERYKLHNKRVIGWTGSFRNFHGLETVLEAFKNIRNQFDDVVLMLVGDGLEFENTKRIAKELGIEASVIFTGRQPFTLVPLFVSNFYIALVSASTSEGFHYSPLKLREYLATGRAVIAPRAGSLPQYFEDNMHIMFYDAGDASDLTDKLDRLLRDEKLCADLRKNAQALFEKEGTWIHELQKVCKALNITV